MRNRDFSLVFDLSPGTASWTRSLCSGTGSSTQMGSVLGVMLCCRYLDIYSNFCARTLALHFALGLTHFASGLAQASGQMVALFTEMEKTGRGQFFLGGAWSSLLTIFSLRSQLDNLVELLDKLSN